MREDKRGAPLREIKESRIVRGVRVGNLGCCGYRSPSKDGVGIYLMGEGVFAPCERLPFPLFCCPTCNGGIKASRAWAWIQPSLLFAPALPPPCTHDHNSCGSCWLCVPPQGRHGLLFVGEQSYPSPHDFRREAIMMGISRRLPAIPNGLEIGTTVIYLAHRKAVLTGLAPPYGDRFEASAGVFMVFQPTRIDLVVDTTDPDQLSDRAKRLAEKLGDKASLVKVVPADVTAPLFPADGEPRTELAQ